MRVGKFRIWTWAKEITVPVEAVLELPILRLQVDKAHTPRPNPVTDKLGLDFLKPPGLLNSYN